MVQLCSAIHVWRHDLFRKMISSMQFAFTIGSSAAKQLWSLCGWHRLLGIKNAIYHATSCERTGWVGCAYIFPICRLSPQLGAERSRRPPGVLAAIFETLHGKGQRMPKSWTGTWELFGATISSVDALTSEFTTCFLFDNIELHPSSIA